MPDTKITALTAIGANPIIPATFPIPMVDLTDTSMAASGTTKKVTVNQILGAGGTATLASATITGDLTVRTTGLIVNATGTGVQVSPSAPLCVKTRNSDSVGLRVLQSTGGTSGIQFTDDPVTADWGSILATSANLFLGSNSLLQLQTGGATERLAISSTGICTWSNVGGVAGTAMTLNSTGLGIGISPSGKLDVNVGAGGFSYFRSTTYSNLEINGRSGGAGVGGCQLFLTTTGSRSWLLGQRTDAAYGASNSFFIRDDTAAVTRLEIDTSGNVGIGVTPSYKLHVAGRISYTGTIGEGADATLSSSGTALLHGNAAAWTSQTFYTGGTSRAVIKQNGQVRFVPLAADPASAEAGDVYYNSTSNKLKCYNGTTWNDLF
jgi:hypothetical protein